MGTIRPVTPLLITSTAKGCFPVPVVMSGTFSTTSNKVSISGIVRSSTTATVTTATSHNRSVGDIVIITGAVQPEYNGKKRIATAPTELTFTFFVESTATSPATGTMFVQDVGCVATGVGTLAGTQFDVGSFIYVPALNAIREVTGIRNALQWEFTRNFPSDVSSGTLVRIVPAGMYKGIGVTVRSGSPVWCETTIEVTDPPPSNVSENGLNPVCWDATGAEILININSQGEDWV